MAVVGDEQVTRAEYDHYSAIARAGSPDQPKAQQRRGTMQYLLTLIWIRGEARERGVRVTRAQLDAEIDRIRRRNFPEPGAYRAFLRRSKMTRQDAREQVELNLLTTRLARQVTRGITGTRARKRAKARYGRQLRARWRPRTRCARHFRTRECAKR